MKRIAAFMGTCAFLLSGGAWATASPSKEVATDASCRACHPVTVCELPAGHPEIDDSDEELCTRLRSVFEAVSQGRFLAASHAAKNVSCRECHDGEMPEVGADVENETCVSCHEYYDARSRLTKAGAVEGINPHKSHLGEIACSVCHRAHGPSRAYCLECHSDFHMPMPGKKQETAPQPFNPDISQ
jgi:hypothetical protein